MFMCCFFCGVDLCTVEKYNKRQLSTFSDHLSLWRELASKCNGESSTNIDIDAVDNSLMCRNCFHKCCTYFDQRREIYERLKNAWSKFSQGEISQVSLGKRSRSGQGQDEPPRKRLFAASATGSPGVSVCCV